MKNIGALILTLSLASGCVATSLPIDVGPSLQDEERATSIVWDQTIKMTAFPPPTIAWRTPCAQPFDDKGQAIETSAPNCWTDSVHTDGTVDLRWTGKVSSSAFALELITYKRWLVAHQLTYDYTQSGELVDAQAALRAAGL